MSTPVSQRPAPRPGFGEALRWNLGFVGLLWLVEVADLVLVYPLDREGIRPLDLDGLSGVLLAPLLHAGFGHLMANSVPLLVLGFLLVLSGVRRWGAVTAVVWLVGGLGTWLVAAPGTVHVGASGLVFGWLVYLLLRGFISRRPGEIAIGLIVLFFYGGLLWGVLPGQPGVSWQGHLFGAVGGGLAAWWFAPADRHTREPVW